MAQYFTSAEREQNKFVYSGRKMFWDLVSNMIARGYTSDVVIDEIYTTYGQALAVSTILVKLRGGKRRGGHLDSRPKL